MREEEGKSWMPGERCQERKRTGIKQERGSRELRGRGRGVHATSSAVFSFSERIPRKAGFTGWG
eukprot:2339818-Rhodomonas_salina.2